MIMEKYTYEEIRNNILSWIHGDKIKDLLMNDEFEVLESNNNILLINLTFNYCLAQIIVNKPCFAPYQFVSFEAMTLDSEKAHKTGNPELVYFFYDAKRMTKEMVINELEHGLKYCVRYIPSYMRNKYLFKRGLLSLELKDLYCVVHPDDISKIEGKNVKGEFVCIETEAQYLVVSNEVLSIRILPQNFNVID